MKLLFILVFAPLCLAYCPSGHYKDLDLKKCIKCTPCHIVSTPCSKYKDAVCSPNNDSETHHFQKNRIHFFDYSENEDDGLDDELSDKNFVGNFYDVSHYHHKDHHKKGMKHSKTKHPDKHHHKKKHFEFDDDYSYDNFDYGDQSDFDFENTEKPKKHTKHYELNSKAKKGDTSPLLTPTEIEDEKLHFILNKDAKKNKKSSHLKKIDADEEKLEEWLLQSQKKLKIRKDNLLKTLKGEKVGGKSKKQIRLNSPVFEADKYDDYDQTEEVKRKKNSDSAALKALADLKESDDELDLPSFMTNKEDDSSSLKSDHSSDEVVGEGKIPEEELKKEMGKNYIYEKPHFKVIPMLVGKDYDKEKKDYVPKHHSPPQQKLEWDENEYDEDDDDDDEDDDNEEENDEELHEMKSNEVVSLPFTAAETLVWDWQAVAVASAVASCLVFFLVVSIYFIVNSRQWKKVNKSYNKEFEEMSTRIALMHPTLESGCPDSHTTSLYLENITSPVKEEEKKCDHKV